MTWNGDTDMTRGESTNRTAAAWAGRHRFALAAGCAVAAVFLGTFVGLSACRPATPPGPQVFAAPEDAVHALTRAATKGNLDELIAIFGPDGRALIASSDPASARRNREVFVVAVAERWRLVDDASNAKTLVIGNEEWPFPVPLVKDADGWHFDTAAGAEEVLARRIGRNELAAIRICQVYVMAQRVYAKRGHDGSPPGVYAARFESDPDRENGLYWPSGHGRKRSPLGDLLARAADDARAAGRDRTQPAPFHGYYFRILTGQGPAARGGARSYMVGGRMTRGFGLIAWPAHYDRTGVMTFVVNHDGVVYQKDLGPDSAAVSAISLYDPDPSWTKAE